jgi:signal transduction histidine kinase
LRVFAKGCLDENRWLTSVDTPVTMEFVNDRFCEILKLSRHFIESNPSIISDFVYEPDKPDFAKKNVEANLMITPFVWEGRFLVYNDIIWLHLESMPRVLENGDSIWTGILYDITDRKKAELALSLENEDLLKVNADKDKLFSIIAHDLKNPINSIVGFSEILTEQIMNKDFAGIEEYADIILHSSQRASNLLVNLMQWSLSKTGRMSLDPESFDLVSVIDENILLFSIVADKKGIAISKIVPSELFVFADKAIISTIVRNLISNAVKFTKHGGEIFIMAEYNQSFFSVSICDSRVGITSDCLDKLFLISEKDSRLDTVNEYGTGLGLILCKELIEKQGGQIWAESEDGVGSKFYFTIPQNIDSLK